MVVVVAGLRIHVVAVQQEAHKEEVLASRRGLGGSSSWDCKYCCMGLWLVACIGPLHWLVQPQSLLLKAHLAMLSLVLSVLTIEAWLIRHRCLSHCLYFMLIPHFKIFQPPG